MENKLMSQMLINIEYGKNNTMHTLIKWRNLIMQFKEKTLLIHMSLVAFFDFKRSHSLKQRVS